MSDRVRFGVLSTARISKKLLAGIAGCEQAELVAVSSRDADKLSAYCAENELTGSVRRHHSYEDLLADPEVDAIYNPLPNALHCDWTIAAAEAGKAVLCEKPLAVDVAECLDMISAAETHGVLFMEAFMYRQHPATRRLKEVIDEGAIGDVRLVRSGFCFTIADPANIRLSQPLAGGATMDVGCYCINFSRYLCGAEPVEAYAVATFGPESKVDETLCATLRFESGAVAQFDCSVKSAGRAFGDVLGSDGTIQVNRPWFPNAERAVFTLNGNEEAIEDGGDPYQNEVAVFCHSYLTGDPLPIPPIDGARNVAVLNAVLESARRGKPVEVTAV